MSKVEGEVFQKAQAQTQSRPDPLWTSLTCNS